MLVLFATKGLELVAYLEYSNHTTTERVGWFMVLKSFEIFEATRIMFRRKCVFSKVTMNSLHTILKPFEVSTTQEMLRFSN